MSKYKKYLIPAYILLLVFSFFYVRSVLNNESIKVMEKEKIEENVFEIKPAVTYLNIEGGESYRVRLTNANSVYDILEYLRDENKLYFEKTSYTYGTELDIVNTLPPNGYLWKVYYGDKDITYAIEELKIKDKDVYTIKLVPIHTSELQ